MLGACRRKTRTKMERYHADQAQYYVEVPMISNGRKDEELPRQNVQE